jgi:hypothetical protein
LALKLSFWPLDPERIIRGKGVGKPCARLRALVTSAFIQLAITERDQRLLALQDRWDRVRQAVIARSAGDYRAMMRTDIVCRRLKWIGGVNGHEVEEYEIDTGVIEALNSVEKRAAIETGQEQENVNLTGQISARSIALSKVMSIHELESLEKILVLCVPDEYSAVSKPAKSVSFIHFLIIYSLARR